MYWRHVENSGKGTDDVVFTPHITSLLWNQNVDILKSSLTWHGRIAGQEQRPTLLKDPRESVTDGIHPEVRPIVANTNHYRGFASLG